MMILLVEMNEKLVTKCQSIVQKRGFD